MIDGNIRLSNGSCDWSVNLLEPLLSPLNLDGMCWRECNAACATSQDVDTAREPCTGCQTSGPKSAQVRLQTWQGRSRRHNDQPLGLRKWPGGHAEGLPCLQLSALLHALCTECLS